MCLSYHSLPRPPRRKKRGLRLSSTKFLLRKGELKNRVQGCNPQDTRGPEKNRNYLHRELTILVLSWRPATKEACRTKKKSNAMTKKKERLLISFFNPAALDLLLICFSFWYLIKELGVTVEDRLKLMQPKKRSIKKSRILSWNPISTMWSKKIIYKGEKWLFLDPIVVFQKIPSLTTKVVQQGGFRSEESNWSWKWFVIQDMKAMKPPWKNWIKIDSLGVMTRN